MRTACMILLLSLIVSHNAFGKPIECGDMEPVFITSEWENSNSKSYRCLGTYFPSDGAKYFFTVTSKENSEDVERYNFAVLFSSVNKDKIMADIFRLIDNVNVLLRKKVGKNAPEYIVKAALNKQDGEYYFEKLRLTISTKSWVTDMSISIWK